MIADARFVDVTYRGLRVATRARLVETGPGAGFVEVEAPLPVGTELGLAGDATLEVRVTGVVEQEAGAKGPPGMRVSWAQVGAAASPDASAAGAPDGAAAPAAADPPASASSPTATSQLGAASSDPASPEAGDASGSGAFGPEDGTPGGDGRRRRRRTKTQTGRS